MYAAAYVPLLICVSLIIFAPTPIVFIVLSIDIGYFTLMFYTIPFMLLEDYRKRPEYSKNRGLAGDCSLLTISASLGQVLGSIFIAILLQNRSAEDVIPYYCAASAFLGLLVVVFLIDYKTEDSSE